MTTTGNSSAYVASAAEFPRRSPAEWAVLDTLRGHLYDTRNRGSKPADPGWHVCSCGWEGYWTSWQPHVAERIMQAIQVAEDAESERMERKVPHA